MRNAPVSAPIFCNIPFILLISPIGITAYTRSDNIQSPFKPRTPLRQLSILLVLVVPTASSADLFAVQVLN